MVPTAVRVEAGWDRRSPRAAVINRLAIEDVPLGSVDADQTATLTTTRPVSVTDAHIGATIVTCAGNHVSVLTSDPSDVLAVAGDHPVRILTL